jgi:hypothetical protein
MKQGLLLLVLALAAHAQSPADKPNAQNSPDAADKASAKLHADAIKLVEATGARQRVQGGLKQMLEEGKKYMMGKCPACKPAFSDEWEKRMLERLKVEDFLAVYVRVYEKYFTDEEITELISLQSAKQDSPPRTPSPALKQKLDKVMPSLMGEAIGGCSEIGAKLGAEVGAEIQKEHPDYVGTESKPEEH